MDVFNKACRLLPVTVLFSRLEVSVGKDFYLWKASVCKLFCRCFVVAGCSGPLTSNVLYLSHKR